MFGIHDLNMTSPVINKNPNFRLPIIINGSRSLRNGLSLEDRFGFDKGCPGENVFYRSSRDVLPNPFQWIPNWQTEPDDFDEIDSCFNKRFTFHPPVKGWQLPDVEKMYVAERWEDKEMMKMKDELNAVKNKLNSYDMDSWHRHTKAMNKAGNVVNIMRNTLNAEFVTQAWCKFYEICYSYALVSHLAEKHNYLNSLHLCEAPGAFITSLNHYLQLNHPNMTWKWLATTLNPYYEGNPLPKMINDDRFILHTQDHWKFGADYTGNLMDLENLRFLATECRKLGPILMITADGSIACFNDPGEQEATVFQLVFCEVVSALHILSIGGNFIVKMFTMYEAETICLMYLLVCCFDSVKVYKPATSKEGNSENYVVCLGYCGVEFLKPWLKILRSKFSSEQPKEVMFSLDDIPKDFMEQQKACCEMFKNYQTEVIERNIFVYNHPDNQGSLRKMKRLSYAVADEYIRRYNLRAIHSTYHIVGSDVLKHTKTPNVDVKESIGSFNDFQEKQKIRGFDKVKLLREDINRDIVCWTYEEDIKWIQFQNYSNNFKIVTGKPVTSVHSSKFCLGKVLTTRNELLSLANELGYTNPILITSPKLYSEELSVEMKDTIQKCNPGLLKSVKVLNYKEKLWVSLGSGRNESFERCAFFDIMELIDTLWRDENFILQGYPMLTQFTAGVIYMIGHLFEKVGFVRPSGQDFAVIFNKYRSWNVKMKKFLKDLDDQVDQLEENKSVLAVIPLKEIVFGHKEFYKSVTSINSLCVQEQNRDIIAQMIEQYEKKRSE